MAFKDITKVLYDGKVKLDYKDKAHRYYVRFRENWDLPEDDAKAWSKIVYPKGTTTLLGDTLEKKGLMTWPLGLAIRELFGFYDFTTDEGNQMTGFSKGVGTMWEDGKTKALTPDELLPIVKSANSAWTRAQKKGADIGSVVHDAIEHYVLANPNNPEKEAVESVFDIAEQYMWNIKEAITDIDSPEYDLAMQEFESDVEMAKKAFAQFTAWWDAVKPVLYGAEDLLYSLEHNVCGTYDGDIGVPITAHPVPELFEGKDIGRCSTDFSNVWCFFQYCTKSFSYSMAFRRVFALYFIYAPSYRKNYLLCLRESNIHWTVPSRFQKK
jgi:hypothetical protein